MAPAEKLQKAVATAVSFGSYTWTFPGCPIRIRLRLEVVDALERLIAQLEASATLAPLAGGLLLGDTATPGVTEIAGMQPLPALDPGGVEAAVGDAECEVVGFFRAERGNPMQPGASLQMTEDDIALADGLFRQPSSVVLLIETLEAEKPKAAFFFWDGGKMLGDFSLMDFPLDPHQLAALERQRTTPRSSPQIDQELALERVKTAESGGGRLWLKRAAWAVGAVAIFGLALHFYLIRLSGRAASDVRQPAAESALRNLLRFQVDRQGADLLLSWDRRSPAITGATFGVVLIRENDRTRNVSLTPEQLRSGSIRYKPGSDEVDVELNVAIGDHLLKESVIAVLP